jgi:hypothetical protein
VLAVAEQKFRRLIAIGDEIAAAWPFAESQLIPAALTPSSISRLVEHELHRIGHKPFVRAGLPQEQSFPGGRSPSINFMGRPHDVPPISEEMKRASDYARKVMRGEAPREAPEPEAA